MRTVAETIRQGFLTTNTSYNAIVRQHEGIQKQEPIRQRAADRLLPLHHDPAVGTGQRPHLSGTLEGSDTIFLVDTGSAISCISEEKYRSLPGHWTLEEAPPGHGLRLSSASGHDIQICLLYTSPSPRD